MGRRLRSAAIAVAAATLAAACQKGDRPAATIPPATGAITIDGEETEPDWNARALRFQLVDDHGAPARPYSEVRLLHDAHDLLIGLYAADEDIRSTDHWDLKVGGASFAVNPRGVLTPAGGGVRAAADVDEDTTIDKSDDFDEEWIVEIAVPLEVAGDPAAITAKRCDVPKDGIERCGQWTGSLRIGK